jgi:hypothetical protein
VSRWCLPISIQNDFYFPEKALPYSGHLTHFAIFHGLHILLDVSLLLANLSKIVLYQSETTQHFFDYVLHGKNGLDLALPYFGFL